MTALAAPSGLRGFQIARHDEQTGALEFWAPQRGSRAFTILPPADPICFATARDARRCAALLMLGAVTPSPVAL